MGGVTASLTPHDYEHMRPGGGLGGGWGSSQDLAAAPWEPTTWGHSEEEQLPASWIDTRWTPGRQTSAPPAGLPRCSAAGTSSATRFYCCCCWRWSVSSNHLLLIRGGGGPVYRWYMMPFQRCNNVNVVISICVTTKKLPSLSLVRNSET